MRQLTAALLSSLQGLALDPEDPVGKHLMAQVRSIEISHSIEFYINGFF